MGRLVTIAAGYEDIALPNNLTYDAGQSVILTDDEWAQVNSSLVGTVLIDGGATGSGSPGADGQSAYDIAVANGFVGDETAWLASLDGAPGADGVGFSNLGDWSASTTYSTDDVVRRMGGVFRALQASTGEDPMLGITGVINCSTGTPANGSSGMTNSSLGQTNNLMHFTFTGTTGTTVDYIDVFVVANAHGAGRIGINSTNTGGAPNAATWLGYADVTANQFDGKIGQWVRLKLNQTVTLTNNTAYTFYNDGASAATTYDITAGGEQDRLNISTWSSAYGTTYQNALAGTILPMRLVQQASHSAYWSILAPPSSDFDSTGQPIPYAAQDWQIGNPGLETSNAAPNNRARAWFRVYDGAFRAGQTAGQWTPANVGYGSIALGNQSTARGAESVAIGQSNVSSGQNSSTLGQSCQATGAQSLAMGYNCLANGTGSISMGQSNTASGDYSLALGIDANPTRSVQETFASGVFVTVGDAQSSRMVLLAQTTDATNTNLTSRKLAASYSGNGTNVITIGTSRAMTLRVQVAARRTDVQGEMAGWTIEQAFGRDSTGNVRALGNPFVHNWYDTAAAAWNAQLVADTTNQAIHVQVTGEASKTIRWVANVEFTEVSG